MGRCEGWRDLDQDKTEQNSTKRGSSFDARPSPRKCLSICLSSVLCLVREYCYLSWLTKFPGHYLSPVYHGRWRDVLGGILSHNVSQHLTTEMYAHKDTEVHIPRICPLASQCGDIYNALCLLLETVHCTGHPGLRGDAEQGMFNYAIVSAVTAAGSANTGAKKETNFIVVNIPISVPAKSFPSKLSLYLGPLVADLRRMCLFIWMISFSQIPFLSGVIIEWLQHPESRVKHNVGVIPPPAVQCTMLTT